jgi:hypothetical protein
MSPAPNNAAKHNLTATRAKLQFGHIDCGPFTSVSKLHSNFSFGD